MLLLLLLPEWTLKVRLRLTTVLSRRDRLSLLEEDGGGAGEVA